MHAMPESPLAPLAELDVVIWHLSNERLELWCVTGEPFVEFVDLLHM